MDLIEGKCICEKENIFMEREVLSESMLQWCKSFDEEVLDAARYNVGVLIDIRCGQAHLRLVNTDDYNCIEAGSFIHINYCPVCGKQITVKEN